MRRVEGPLAALVMVSSVSAAWASSERTPLVRAGEEISESKLLDVHVTVFEPADDFFPEVRDAEAHYVPGVLKRVLEASGFWGAVRVVPDAGHPDVTISGDVVRSHGGRLELEIRVTDATGDVWVDDTYKAEADASEYLDPRSTVDPFLDVYHRIANDVSKKYRKLDREDVEAIRAVSRLRFAAELAPKVFADYLRFERERYRLARLPARDDPMMDRVERIRARDRVFVDTVDAYYGRLYARMVEPYHGWRSQDYWQREAMKNGPPTAQRSGGRNAPLGVLRVGGGRGWPGDAMLCGTADGRARPCQDERELDNGWRGTHLDVLRELGASLAADVAPLVVDVEDRVGELTGSVDEQFAKWRTLLRDIFAVETGVVQ